MTTRDVAEAFDPGSWEFTPEVVEQFDTHVRQSVPHYDLIQDTVAELADWLAPPGSLVADLGVATGETCRRIADRHPSRDLAFVGYDTSADMLSAARGKVPGIQTHQVDITAGLTHQDANLTVSLFTLQFLPPEARALTLSCALTASTPEGALLIAEKVRPPDARWFEIATELSWDHKATSGIADSAIRAKARALRGVLRPSTEDELVNLIESSGWRSVTCLFRWHQWCLFGAFA